MAENRFDGLSKKLSSRFSRRTMIKGAGAALGAGAVASVGGASAGAIFCTCGPCPFPLNEVPFNYDTCGCASVVRTQIGTSTYAAYRVQVRVDDLSPGVYQVYLGSLCTNATTANPYLYVGQISVGPFGVGCLSKTVYRNETIGTTCPSTTAEVIVGQHGPGGTAIPHCTTGIIPANCQTPA